MYEGTCFIFFYLFICVHFRSVLCIVQHLRYLTFNRSPRPSNLYHVHNSCLNFYLFSLTLSFSLRNFIPYFWFIYCFKMIALKNKKCVKYFMKMKTIELIQKYAWTHVACQVILNLNQGERNHKKWRKIEIKRKKSIQLPIIFFLTL